MGRESFVIKFWYIDFDPNYKCKQDDKSENGILIERVCY